MERLQGIFTALVTPFTEGGETIAEEVLGELVRRQVVAGVGGLVPCGTTGEFAALSVEERCRVVEVVVEAAGGAVPVIPQTGAVTTRETIHLSQRAQAAGAFAVMVVPPYYECPGWEAVVEHYQAVAAAVSIPVMFYNLPSTTGLVLTERRVAEVAAIPGVEYMKDSGGDAVFQYELLQGIDEHLQVLNGWDSLTFISLVSGAKAVVWGAASVIPELAVQLFDAVARKGDLAKGQALWSQIFPICRILEESGDYASAVKAGCAIVGIDAGPPRLPRLPAALEVQERLQSSLTAVGASAK